VERTTETFVLNDFYNLLDEEITTTESLNGAPPTTDFTQKVYTTASNLSYSVSLREHDISTIFWVDGISSTTALASIGRDTDIDFEYSAFGLPKYSSDKAMQLYEGMEWEPETQGYTLRGILYNPENNVFDKTSTRNASLMRITAAFANDDIITTSYTLPFGRGPMLAGLGGCVPTTECWWEVIFYDPETICACTATFCWGICLDGRKIRIMMLPPSCNGPGCLPK
jgi:hypothetical protein